MGASVALSFARPSEEHAKPWGQRQAKPFRRALLRERGSSYNAARAVYEQSGNGNNWALG